MTSITASITVCLFIRMYNVHIVHCGNKTPVCQLHVFKCPRINCSRRFFSCFCVRPLAGCSIVWYVYSYINICTNSFWGKKRIPYNETDPDIYVHSRHSLWPHIILMDEHFQLAINYTNSHLLFLFLHFFRPFKLSLSLSLSFSIGHFSLIEALNQYHRPNKHITSIYITIDCFTITDHKLHSIRTKVQ